MPILNKILWSVYLKAVTKRRQHTTSLSLKRAVLANLRVWTVPRSGLDSCSLLSRQDARLQSLQSVTLRPSCLLFQQLTPLRLFHWQCGAGNCLSYRLAAFSRACFTASGQLSTLNSTRWSEISPHSCFLPFLEDSLFFLSSSHVYGCWNIAGCHGGVVFSTKEEAFSIIISSLFNRSLSFMKFSNILRTCHSAINE